ncbi:MAG: helicase-related protein, partial [Bacteroidota bacterium]
MEQKLNTILDNREANTVLEALKKLLPEAKTLDVATGNFEIGSLLALDNFWNSLEKIRVIMGHETTKRTKKELVESLRKDSEESIEREKERNDALPGLQAVRKSLADRFIETKVYTRAKFHAKAMLMKMKPPHLSNYGIVGSSNFTEPGLCRNVELNLLTTEQHQLQALQSWFETHWNEAEEVREEILKVIEPHLREYLPFEVYCKALYEYFNGKEFRTAITWEEQESKVYSVLSRYQKDGYHQALRIAKDWNGALICDGVGLGKTYIGLMLLEYFIVKEKKHVLLIVPKSARESVWERDIRKYLKSNYPIEVRHHLETKNHTDFGREETIPKTEFNYYKKYFDAIIVDEAHHFRTPSATRTILLNELAENKQLFLLTATPVNNSLDDLYHLINLFAQDRQNHFARIAIPNLRRHFNTLEDQLLRIIQGKSSHPQGTLFDVQEEVLTSSMFRTDALLKEVMIQRSRAYVKSVESMDEVKPAFPERQPPEVINYSLIKVYADLFPTIKKMFDPVHSPLSLDIYNPEKYKKPEAGQDVKVMQYEMRVVGLIRTMLLKRLESSYKAFEASLEELLLRLADFVEANNPERWKEWLEKNKQNWEIVKQHQSERGYEEMEEDDRLIELEKEKLNPDEYRLTELLPLVESDMTHLVGLLAGVYGNLSPEKDDKLSTLVNQLKTNKLLKENKVIIFTEFRDTARYLFEQLKNNNGFQDIEEIDSTRKGTFREAAIKRFAPYYNCDEDEVQKYLQDPIRILISTDVLSEGLNLQDANIIINYDLHWNPVRLMQRIGRVDRRIDRTKPVHHEKVYFYNFLPPNELEELLHLLERVSGKVLRINKTLGLEAPLLKPDDPFEPIRLFNEAFEQTKSAEEKMHEALLKLQKEFPTLFEELHRYPKRVLSGKKAGHAVPKGLFACYRFPNLNPESKTPGEVRWYYYHYETEVVVDDLD